MSGNTRINRRTFLRGAGATFVLLTGGGVYRAVDRGVFDVAEGPAYEPWINWRDDQLGPLNVVRAAILAANPHNMQPWLFRVTDRQIDVYVDTARHIGKVDPFFRELWIGVGCALENIALAAAAEGYRTNITLTPDAAQPTYAARVTLTPAPARVSDLYNAIPKRHTNRAAYDTRRQIDQATLDALTDLNDMSDMSIIWLTSLEAKQRFSDEMLTATDAFIADEEQLFDSESKFRQSGSAIQQHRDGITLDAQSGSPLFAAVVKMLPDTPPGTGATTFRNGTRTQVRTAAAFGILAVPDVRNNRQRLQGGRLWQRMHLWATTQNIAMQPLSQLTERTDREIELGVAPRFGSTLNEMVRDQAKQALFCFRIGYPTTVALPSPRRSVDDVML